MNEFNENNLERQDLSLQSLEISGLPKIEISPEVIQTKVSDYWNQLETSETYSSDNISEFAENGSEMSEVKGDSEIYHDTAREYGLQECAESAKEIFTRDVISNWGVKDVETRNEITQQYAKAIADGLDIDLKGIVWEQFSVEDGSYTFGYNAGDGYIHLNADFLTNPGMIMYLIDTVAHEARHQFQSDVIANPEKFGIDEATVNEWKTGNLGYTKEAPSAYDPWGYFYNPLEIDSRYFGQTIVRELTKDLINA